MTTSPMPRRVEWSGPEGWTVWADEDGVHVRAAGGNCLEQPDVERLLGLWMDAKDAVRCGAVVAPKPPTREEAQQHAWHRREENMLRRARRALDAEFTIPDSPF